jgi:hypothetical protein
MHDRCVELYAEQGTGGCCLPDKVALIGSPGYKSIATLFQGVREEEF